MQMDTHGFFYRLGIAFFQRGSYVNKISLSQVRNGCFVRQAIECAVVRRAAGMINEEQLYQLEQNLHQQRIAVDRQQLNDFFLLDDEFHQKLSIIADCQLAWETVENIKAAIDRVRYMSLDHVTSPEMLLRQHHEIFTALGTNLDKSVFRQLNEGFAHRLTRHRKTHGDFFLRQRCTRRDQAVNDIPAEDAINLLIDGLRRIQLRFCGH